MRKINLPVLTTSDPLPGQTKNNSGGYGWEVSKIDQLRKFLILGITNGTFYLKETDLFKSNVEALRSLLKTDGIGYVNEIILFAEQNRAPKREPMVFALAYASIHGDLETKRAANQAVKIVCSTPTDLFSYVEYCQKLSAPTSGWSRARRKTVSDWYNGKSIRDLIYHITKYKQRNGWSNKDLFRLAHIKAPTEEHNMVYRLVTKGALDLDFNTLSSDESRTAFARLVACEEIHQLKASSADDVKTAIGLIREHKLVHEHVPTEFQAKAEIWEAMLPEMPLNAAMRNLGRMTHLGLISPNSNATTLLLGKFSNEYALKKSRLHPFNILTACRQYMNGGEGGKGKLRWQPTQQIGKMLEDTFYSSFQHIEPTNKRYLFGIDVSHSMVCPVTGSEIITCNVAAAALAMVSARTEKLSYVMAFDNGIRDVGINSSQDLDTVINKVSKLNGGGTDCSLPMIYALQNKIPVDVFVVMTDSENNPGREQPSVVLQRYRDQMGIDARLVVYCLTSSNRTIANPNDRGMLDCVGFDSASPRILREFSLGTF